MDCQKVFYELTISTVAENVGLSGFQEEGFTPEIEEVFHSRVGVLLPTMFFI